MLTLNKSKTLHLLLTFSLCKTPLGETGCLGNPYSLFYWLPTHPVFWFTPNTVSQTAYGYLPSLYSTCMTYETSCHAISHQVPSTPAFNVIHHPSVSYCQVFKPILYFQPSSLQSESWLYPNPYLGKQRIYLGMAIFLIMCFCPHT